MKTKRVGGMTGKHRCEACRKFKSSSAFVNGGNVCRVCTTKAYHCKPSAPDRDPGKLAVLCALETYDEKLRHALGPRWWTTITYRLRQEGVEL